MHSPVRHLPDPVFTSDGGWTTNSCLTSTADQVRGLVLISSKNIIPVIVVPGIMGSNLRSKFKPQREDERIVGVKPGGPVWRPPDTTREKIKAVYDWSKRSPSNRQRLFSAAALEVDEKGAIENAALLSESGVSESELRQRGWGEIHLDSYGILLSTLQLRLNRIFHSAAHKRGLLSEQWKEVMRCDPRRWGVSDFGCLAEAHLEKLAQFHFPVYAVGYNWLECCAKSSERLEKRILEILEYWKRAKRHCDKVIIVTHSMGGLVTRACAQRIPDKIAGVIHGVMPALGAPAAYRRIACGTESSSPSNNFLENWAAALASQILGDTTEKTTPVLSHSPGALELLPNQLYPRPWLFVHITPGNENVRAGDSAEEASDYLRLPGGNTTNPYDIYRDMKSWYRLINPTLTDPAGLHQKTDGGATKAVMRSIATAEKFHRSLQDYYHPCTFAFYGHDADQMSFGQIRWLARRSIDSKIPFTPANIARAEFLRHTTAGNRQVIIEGTTKLEFQPEHQDAPGDGTVPHASGAGPIAKIRRIFATNGYDHQGSYKDGDMLKLTLRLVSEIVQDIR